MSQILCGDLLASRPAGLELDHARWRTPLSGCPVTKNVCLQPPPGPYRPAARANQTRFPIASRACRAGVAGPCVRELDADLQFELRATTSARLHVHCRSEEYCGAHGSGHTGSAGVHRRAATGYLTASIRRWVMSVFRFVVPGFDAVAVFPSAFPKNCLPPIPTLSIRPLKFLPSRTTAVVRSGCRVKV